MSDTFSARWESADDAQHVKAGAYTAVIKGAEVKTREDDKRRYVNWRFVLDAAPYKNRSVFCSNYIDAKPGGKDPIGILKGQCKALGLKPASIEDLALQLESVLDRRVFIKVTEREFNDRVYNDAKITGFASDLIGQDSAEDDVPTF